MGKLERVLELIRDGKSNPAEIAAELNTTVEEVNGLIEILKSLGYVEEVKFGSSACETCPLKKICHGSCLRPTGNKAFSLTDKAFTLKG